MRFCRREFIRYIVLGGVSFLLNPMIGRDFACTMDRDQNKTRNQFKPAYIKLEEEGKLEERIELAYKKLENCTLCPHRCRVNRLNGEKGFCKAPRQAVVKSYNPHFGEEIPLVGRQGSGTIFFSNCNLRCVFCQNWPIAHKGRGNKVSDEEIANMMLDLQHRGAHNINLVTPTHVMPNIINATRIALKKGLKLPLCYNTGGYELPENIELLDGIVDIYLADLKFMDEKKADRYVFTGATDYPKMAQESIIVMNSQVGTLVTDDRNIAQRGLIIRHLVMPNRVSSPREFVNWVVENLPSDTYINLMDQYRVEHEAYDYELISRAITSEEFVEAVEWAKESGLTNLDDRSFSRYERHLRQVN